MAEFSAAMSEDSGDEPHEVCGISGDILKDDFVKFPCGHCFNYADYLRYAVTLAPQPQRCPYCRYAEPRKLFKIQSYVDEVPRSAAHVSSRQHFNHRRCEHVFSRGKKKDAACGASSARDTPLGPRCPKHRV